MLVHGGSDGGSGREARWQHLFSLLLPLAEALLLLLVSFVPSVNDVHPSLQLLRGGACGGGLRSGLDGGRVFFFFFFSVFFFLQLCSPLLLFPPLVPHGAVVGWEDSGNWRWWWWQCDGGCSRWWQAVFCRCFTCLYQGEGFCLFFYGVSTCVKNDELKKMKILRNNGVFVVPLLFQASCLLPSSLYFVFSLCSKNSPRYSFLPFSLFSLLSFKLPFPSLKTNPPSDCVGRSTYRAKRRGMLLRMGSKGTPGEVSNGCGFARHAFTIFLQWGFGFLQQYAGRERDDTVPFFFF